MVARLFSILVPLAAFVAAGAAFQAILPRPLERSISARLGYAFLLGVAWMGLVSWTLGLLLGAPVGPKLFFGSVVAVLFAALAAITVRRGGLGGLARCRRVGASRRWLGLLPAVVVIGATSLALLADAAVQPVHDFDGRMTWGTQARYLRAARSVLPPILVDPRAYVIHPRYPILLPLVQVGASELAGVALDGFAVRPFYVLFFAALAAVAVPPLRRIGGARAAGLVLVLLFSAPALLWDPDVGPRGTYSDFPFAAFLGAGFLVLIDPRTRHERWRGVVAGLLLAAAAASKNEGMLFAPLATALALAAGLRRAAKAPRVRRSPAAPLIAGALVLAALALVVSWRLQIPNRNDEGYLERFTPAAVIGGLVTRTPAIANAVIEESLDPKEWGGVFWVAPLLVATGRRALRSRAVLASLALIGGQGALAGSAYALAPGLGIVEVTWSRFVVQMLVPLAIVFTAAARGTLLAARLRPRGKPKYHPEAVGGRSGPAVDSAAMPRLSVIIPAYNERATVEELLRRVAEAPLPEGVEREVVVVDDGSTDGTRELLRELAAAGEPPPFRLIEQPANQGKGAAIRAGFAAAGGDLLVVQDADLEYDPREYPKLLQPILDGEADVVYGSRFLGGPHRALFFWHYLGNRFLTTLSNLFTNLNLSDMETCYKVFRREALDGVELRSDRFGIEPELTAKMARRGARIFEVPISYRGRTYAEGKKIGWRDGLAAIWAILRYNLGR